MKEKGEEGEEREERGKVEEDSLVNERDKIKWGRRMKAQLRNPA